MNRIRAGFINVSCFVIFSAAGLSIISDSVAQDADNPALLEADVNQSEDQIIGSIAEAGVNISKDVEQAAIGEGKKDLYLLEKAQSHAPPTATPDDSLEAINAEVEQLEAQSSVLR